MAICKWCETEYNETESDSNEPEFFCSEEHEDYFYVAEKDKEIEQDEEDNMFEYPDED